MDTELWTNESDSYTQRGKGSESNFETFNSLWSKTLFENLSKQGIKPNFLLDIGCSNGALLKQIRLQNKDIHLTGIDPGTQSINEAKSAIDSSINFFQGHVHNLPFENESFDLIILRMVLQWVPRSLLFQSISEIDRVLKHNGIVVIEDFLPDSPLYSKSVHNDKVFIFKEDYKNYLLSSPCYSIAREEFFDEEFGENFRRSQVFLHKSMPFNSYNLRQSVQEKDKITSK